MLVTNLSLDYKSRELQVTLFLQGHISFRLGVQGTRSWLIMYNSTSQSNLRRHQKAAHIGVKYSCDKCDYQTTSNLRVHQQAVHDGIQFSCDQCDFRSAFKTGLL